MLGDGDLVGHSADSRDVVAIVANARAQGIETPYVKFITEDSEPIWMGWL